MVDEEPVDHVSFVSVVLISNKPRFPTKTTSELFKKKNVQGSSRIYIASHMGIFAGRKRRQNGFRAETEESKQ
jgi:hypothetical protein